MSLINISSLFLVVETLQHRVPVKEHGFGIAQYTEMQPDVGGIAKWRDAKEIGKEGGNV